MEGKKSVVKWELTLLEKRKPVQVEVFEEHEIQGMHDFVRSWMLDWKGIAQPRKKFDIRVKVLIEEIQ